MTITVGIRVRTGVNLWFRFWFGIRVELGSRSWLVGVGVNPRFRIGFRIRAGLGLGLG